MVLPSDSRSLPEETSWLTDCPVEPNKIHRKEHAVVCLCIICPNGIMTLRLEDAPKYSGPSSVFPTRSEKKPSLEENKAWLWVASIYRCKISKSPIRITAYRPRRISGSCSSVSVDTASTCVSAWPYLPKLMLLAAQKNKKSRLWREVVQKPVRKWMMQSRNQWGHEGVKRRRWSF